MKIVYYIKAIVYFIACLYSKDLDLKFGLLGLATLMLVFGTQTSIEQYIDKKFAENKK